MASISGYVRRFLDWLHGQTNVRRGAVMGIGFGLLLCVIIFISLLLVTYAGNLGK